MFSASWLAEDPKLNRTFYSSSLIHISNLSINGCCCLGPAAYPLLQYSKWDFGPYLGPLLPTIIHSRLLQIFFFFWHYLIEEQISFHAHLR